MLFKRTSSFLVFFFSLFSINAAEPQIFLCVDSMIATKTSSGQEPQKLVYGYINGQKTSCMSEYELRSLYSKSAYQKKFDAVEKKQRKTIERNAIFKGDKKLAGADLRGMDLQGVDFSEADLKDALLESADLRNANLQNSNLSGADLKDAYCKNTNFCGANLSGAKLDGAFLLNSDLSKTEGLTVEALGKTATLNKSKLDSALSESVEETYPAKMQCSKGTWKQKIFPDIDQDFNSPEPQDLADPEKFK